MTNCSQYYNCNRWDCKACASKKLYWLREQAVNFARLLSGQICYFTTVKGLSSIESALKVLATDKGKIKGYNARYNAKKEYFFTIAKHGRSEWHLHIVSNYDYKIENSHVSVVDNRRAACLYLCSNLEWSIHQNYGHRRRYGATSLLYKQSLKEWYKTRIRLWSIRTRYFMAMIMLRWIVANKACDRVGDRWIEASDRVKSLKILENFSPSKIRPPPFGINC